MRYQRLLGMSVADVGVLYGSEPSLLNLYRASLNSRRCVYLDLDTDGWKVGGEEGD